MSKTIYKVGDWVEICNYQRDKYISGYILDISGGIILLIIGVNNNIEARTSWGVFGVFGRRKDCLTAHNFPKYFTHQFKSAAVYSDQIIRLIEKPYDL